MCRCSCRSQTQVICDAACAAVTVLMSVNMRNNGGGGHRAAAGFTLFEMSLEQGLRQLTEHLTQQLEELRLD